MKLHLKGLLLLTLLMMALPSISIGQERETPLKGPKDATDKFSGVVYGPIDSKDTLWQIANRYRQNQNLSVYQVMVAIYELNPEAFEQNNLNLLIDGATLKLPAERYVARIDKEKARLRTEQDEAAFARMPSVPGNSVQNLKPAVPLVNQEDLSNTKSAIEEKITRLDAQQARQFDDLRQQFASSLESVRSILDDNRKLYERVEKVNDDLQNLRDQVKDDVQTQMDEQLALQKQLLEMLEEQKQQSAQRGKDTSNGSNSAPLIIGSSLFTLLLLGGLAYFLLRKQPAAESATAVATPPPPPKPSAEVDDSVPSLVDDFDDDDELSEDDLFNDDDLLDDVLSNELEDALDDELENFADLDDDMLVPDDEDDFEEGTESLEQDELDSLFDEEDLSSSSIENDAEQSAIDLSDDEIADDFNQAEEEEKEEVSNEAVDEIADTEAEASDEPELEDSIETEPVASDSEAAQAEAAAEPEEKDANEEAPQEENEKPEISIDELLEEEQKEPSLEEKLGDDAVDEGMLEKLDKEIHEQNQDLDRLTDEIIGEIEQIEMMGGLPDEALEENDDEAENTAVSTPSPQSIQDLDALSEGLDEINVDDMANADDFEDPLSDELIAELQGDDNEPYQAADFTESDVEANEEPGETNSDESSDDDLQVHSDSAFANDNADTEEELNDPLSDELLAELEAEGSAAESHMDALSDELMAELEDIETEEATGDKEAEGARQQQSQTEEDKPASEEVTEGVAEHINGEQGDAVTDENSEQSEEAVAEDEKTEQRDDEDDKTVSEDIVDDAAEDVEGEMDNAVADEITEENEALEGEEAEQPDAEEKKPTSDLSEQALASDEIESTDPLDAALEEFDRQMIDDIPSFADSGNADKEEFDDRLLDEALSDFDDFELEQEQDGVVPEKKAAEPQFDELEDVPGLDDWLTGDKKSDHEILDELENSEFDELLGEMEDEEEDDAQQSLQIDNPDLDLETLLTDPDEEQSDDDEKEDDFLDVETLLTESMDDDDESQDEPPLDLDVSLSEFTGVNDEDELVDIDKDAGQSANLDLAMMYIEMDDTQSAKELLQEVIDKGTPDQQQEARSVLNSLG